MATEIASGQYALLHIGNLRVAFSQSDVALIGLTSDVDATLRDGHDCGALVGKEGHWPVYSLNDDLRPEAKLPETRRFCVCLRDRAQGRAFALGCDAVAPLAIDLDTKIEDLPECMRTATMPLTHVVTGSATITFLSSAKTMADYLAGLEASGEQI